MHLGLHGADGLVRCGVRCQQSDAASSRTVHGYKDRAWIEDLRIAVAKTRLGEILLGCTYYRTVLEFAGFTRRAIPTK